MRKSCWIFALIMVAAGCRPQAKPEIEVEPPDDTTAPEQPAVAQGPAPFTFAPFMTGLPEGGMWKCDPVLKDVNNDGVLDLAAIPRLRVPNLGDGPRFWFGAKDGTWTQSSDGLDTGERSCGGGLDLRDIDGDGQIDILAADHCQGLFVYLGDGQGHWNMVTRQLYPEDIVAEPSRATMYIGVEDAMLGDMDGDGFLDIVAGGSDIGGIHVYLGDGSGSNWQRVENSGLPQHDWATRVVVADMNDDGILDVVASFADGPRVWHGDGKGHFADAWEGLPSPIMRGIYTGLAVADINADGLPDFAIANWVDGPEVYLQQADRTWLKAPDVFPQMLGGAVGLDVGDLDNDGKLDMVCSGRLKKDGGYVRGVFALKGDGTGRFEYVPNSGLPTTGLAACAGVTIADIDEDGLMDVAAGSGLVVETTPNAKGPVIPQRLLEWRGTGPSMK
ncbi:MAG TPA: VCBS repeat-containing protein [Phycisphaerae bacterium]|nr:VCBS repeat-containing protein [Phycisphaerae bacterium]